MLYKKNKNIVLFINLLGFMLLQSYTIVASSRNSSRSSSPQGDFFITEQGRSVLGAVVELKVSSPRYLGQRSRSNSADEKSTFTTISRDNSRSTTPNAYLSLLSAYDDTKATPGENSPNNQKGSFEELSVARENNENDRSPSPNVMLAMKMSATAESPKQQQASVERDNRWSPSEIFLLPEFFSLKKDDDAFYGKKPAPRDICDKEKTFEAFGGEAAYREFYTNNPHAADSWFNIKPCANVNCQDAFCLPAATMTAEESFALANIPFGFCQPTKKRLKPRKKAQKDSDQGSQLDDNL